MLKRFLKYYKPHKKIFALDLLASFFVSAIGVLYPIITREMLNTLIPNRNYRMIIISGIALLALYAVRMLLRYFIQYKGHMMGVMMQATMRLEMFRHLEKLPLSFYDNNETGKLMSRMTSDLFDVIELAHHGPENIIISSIAVLSSFIYLSTINLPLTLIIFVCVPFLIVISSSLRKKMKNAFRERRASVAEINASLENSISGIRITKAFNNTKKEEEKFLVGNDKFVSSSSDAYRAMGMFHSSTSFITDVFNVIVMICGGLFLFAGKINFGDYSALILSVSLFLTPITTLIGFMEQFQNGITGFERFIEIIDTPPEADSPDAEPIDEVSGKIEFRNVSVSYNEGKEVLHNIDLLIEPGKKLALVGPSGGGKTTICHLIPHFYSTSGGEIFIDDKEINSITKASLRDKIGIVQQDIYLFNSTIRENILYGKPDATEEEVILAAKRANIHDYIMTLEKGYDTEIGERGVRLSGGQKQRLSIARVFIKNPPILILDEATSALDNATELLIQEALDELSSGRTTIIVAHRLSTIKNADEIAVIADGRITEKGSHEELLASGGLYRTLHDKQFKNQQS